MNLQGSVSIGIGHLKEFQQNVYDHLLSHPGQLESDCTEPAQGGRRRVSTITFIGGLSWKGRETVDPRWSENEQFFLCQWLKYEMRAFVTKDIEIARYGCPGQRIPVEPKVGR